MKQDFAHTITVRAISSRDFPFSDSIDVCTAGGVAAISTTRYDEASLISLARPPTFPGGARKKVNPSRPRCCAINSLPQGHCG